MDSSFLGWHAFDRKGISLFSAQGPPPAKGSMVYYAAENAVIARPFKVSQVHCSVRSRTLKGKLTVTDTMYEVFLSEMDVPDKRRKAKVKEVPHLTEEEDKRDPRIDPRAGDVVFNINIGGNSINCNYKVLLVVPDTNDVIFDYGHGTSASMTSTYSMSRWREVTASHPYCRAGKDERRT